MWVPSLCKADDPALRSLFSFIIILFSVQVCLLVCWPGQGSYPNRQTVEINDNHYIMAIKGSHKKSIFSGPATRKGGGLSTKKKELFLKLYKKFPQQMSNVATKLEGGPQWLATKKITLFFCVFPHLYWHGLGIRIWKRGRIRVLILKIGRIQFKYPDSKSPTNHARINFCFIDRSYIFQIWWLLFRWKKTVKAQFYEVGSGLNIKGCASSFSWRSDPGLFVLEGRIRIWLNSGACTCYIISDQSCDKFRFLTNYRSGIQTWSTFNYCDWWRAEIVWGWDDWTICIRTGPP